MRARNPHSSQDNDDDPEYRLRADVSGAVFFDDHDRSQLYYAGVTNIHNLPFDLEGDLLILGGTEQHVGAVGTVEFNEYGDDEYYYEDDYRETYDDYSTTPAPSSLPSSSSSYYEDEVYEDDYRETYDDSFTPAPSSLPSSSSSGDMSMKTIIRHLGFDHRHLEYSGDSHDEEEIVEIRLCLVTSMP